MHFQNSQFLQKPEGLEPVYAWCRNKYIYILYIYIEFILDTIFIIYYISYQKKKYTVYIFLPYNIQIVYDFFFSLIWYFQNSHMQYTYFPRPTAHVLSFDQGAERRHEDRRHDRRRHDDRRREPSPEAPWLVVKLRS